MVALPPTKKAADKYFIGIFDGDFLVAVMDLIDKYPDDRTVFIGLFMVSKNFQRKGVGTYIVKALSKTLGAEGYKRIRLGYVKTNLSARNFWLKQGFQPTGRNLRGNSIRLSKRKKYCKNVIIFSSLIIRIFPFILIARVGALL